MSLFIFSGDLNGDTSDFNDDFKEDLMSTCEVRGHVVQIPCSQHFMYHLFGKVTKKNLNRIIEKNACLSIYFSTTTATVLLHIQSLVT